MSRERNLNFSQTITIRCEDPAPIIEMLEDWDENQALADIMGYMGIRLLADREDPGRYMIVADFGVVDPDVSAFDEAMRNNERPETQATAAKMRAVLDEDAIFRDYDWEYLTDG